MILLSLIQVALCNEALLHFSEQLSRTALALTQPQLATAAAATLDEAMPALRVVHAADERKRDALADRLVASDPMIFSTPLSCFSGSVSEDVLLAQAERIRENEARLRESVEQGGGGSGLPGSIMGGSSWEFLHTSLGLDVALADSKASKRYAVESRWSQTATDGGGLPEGNATTLTFGIVPDGTVISLDCQKATGKTSNVVGSFFEVHFGSDPALWIDFLANSFNRWSAISGLTFVHEPADDGAATPTSPGVLGVRPDIRIGGYAIDGNNNVLACNYFPDSGDMFIDTADNYYTAQLAGGTIGRGVDNVITHEIGHGLGLNHVCPNVFLMSLSVTEAFLGPQHDELAYAQRFYGDPLEPNNDAATASAVATTAGNVTLSVSVSDDEDWFSLGSLPAYTNVLATVEPFGFSYPQTLCEGTPNPLSTNLIRNLAVRLEKGTPGSTVTVNVADAAGVGDSEVLSHVVLPGEEDMYFLVVFAADTTADSQLYTLDAQLLQLSAAPTRTPTVAPTSRPTPAPTAFPTASPTTAPTSAPTRAPTSSPTPTPTAGPTGAPTTKPTPNPTTTPTVAPTPNPTRLPTPSPTMEPTVAPTRVPTRAPTITATPTVAPTVAPTSSPTPAPLPASPEDADLIARPAPVSPDDLTALVARVVLSSPSVVVQPLFGTVNVVGDTLTYRLVGAPCPARVDYVRLDDGTWIAFPIECDAFAVAPPASAAAGTTGNGRAVVRVVGEGDDDDGEDESRARDLTGTSVDSLVEDEFAGWAQAFRDDDDDGVAVADDLDGALRRCKRALSDLQDALEDIDTGLRADVAVAKDSVRSALNHLKDADGSRAIFRDAGRAGAEVIELGDDLVDALGASPVVDNARRACVRSQRDVQVVVGVVALG